MKHTLFPIILATIALLLPTTAINAKRSHDTIKGKVEDQNGQPMAAVIVEIENTDVYTLSDINGHFCLDMKSHTLPATITFKFVDYFTRHINITPQIAGDSIYITMLPGNDETAEQLSAKHKHKFGAFGISASYSFFNADFNAFTELNDAQIAQLNANSHFFGFGLEANIINIYAHVNFGFAPLRRSFTSQYRHLTDAYSISFNVGYTFPFFKTRTLLITPFIGINHLSYNEYVAPFRPHISLDEYLSLGYVDYSTLQYTASAGAKIAVKIAQFGRHNRQGIYLSASAAYHFKVNKHPYLFSRATHIHTRSSINIFPVTAQASIIYMIGPKIKN